MGIEVSEQQRQAIIEGQPVVLRPTGWSQELILVRADTFRELGEQLESQREQAAWAKLGRLAATHWASENRF